MKTDPKPIRKELSLNQKNKGAAIEKLFVVQGCLEMENSNLEILLMVIK